MRFFLQTRFREPYENDAEVIRKYVSWTICTKCGVNAFRYIKLVAVYVHGCCEGYGVNILSIFAFDVTCIYFVL